MTKVLFIDGPWRGHVRDVVDSRTVQFADYSNAPSLADVVADPSSVSFPVGTYWVHKYVIAGRVLLLGSTSFETPGKLADDVFWDLLASDKAREVAQVVEGVAAGAKGGRQ